MTNKSSQSPLLIGIVVAVLIAAIAGDMIYRSVFQTEDNAPTPAEVTAESEQPVEADPGTQTKADAASEPETEQSPTAEVTEQKQDEPEVASTSSDAAEENITLLLQTVRVDSDGAVVIAGVGLPSQEVEIMLDGEIYETVQADSQGNFVSLFDLPYSDAVRILSLRSTVNGKMIVSDQDAIIAPAQIAAPAVTEPAKEEVAESEDSEASTVIAKADLTEETESQTQAAVSEALSDGTGDDPVTSEDSLVMAQAEDAAEELAQPDEAQKVAGQPETASEPEVVEDEQIAAPVEVAQSESTPSEQTELETATETKKTAEELAEANPVDTENSESQALEGETETQNAGAASSDKDGAQNTNVATTDAGKAKPSEPTQEKPQQELVAVSTKDSTAEPVEPDADVEEGTAEQGVKQTKTTAVAQSPETPEAIKDDGKVAVEGVENATETAQTIEEASQAVETETASNDATENLQTQSGAQEEQAPTVMIADQDGVRVVQSGQDVPDSDVALDAISYDEKGDVALSGRGTPAAQVLVYLDNAPISSTVLDSAGQWKTDLTDVDPGVYTLRIDQLDTSGKVVSRLETPFQREDRERLVQQVAASAEPARVNVVTVQPGYTLWAIARNRYGRGILYVQVFEANREKIRDPDLIYPGQVFQLPD